MQYILIEYIVGSALVLVLVFLNPVLVLLLLWVFISAGGAIVQWATLVLTYNYCYQS